METLRLHNNAFDKLMVTLPSSPLTNTSRIHSMADSSNVLYMTPLFMIQNGLNNTTESHKAYKRRMSDSKHPESVISPSPKEGASSNALATQTVNELPPLLIKQLMKIAENCVIKSNRISRDETPDFVQNCLLKLLLQIDQQRVFTNDAASQYYILKKDGIFIEIERWFGTTATNISIDRYRRLKKQVDGLEIDPENRNSDDDGLSFLVPEPSINLEDELREEKIQEMSLYCAEALDDCMSETWLSISQDSYHNFTLTFTDESTNNDKGIAVASYCQLTLEEKYSNDGKKINSHDSVCEGLGIIIRPENISHKKKKFERLMMQCVTQKMDIQFNASTKQLLQEDSQGSNE